MTADSYGPKNQPRFDATKPPDLGVDETLVSEFAALVGNRKVGTTAERNAATTASSGKEVWDGLEWEDTTLGICVVRRAGSWVPASPVKEWVFARASSNASDTFIQGQYTGVVDGTIPNAPAGFYRFESQLVLSGASASVGFSRIMVNTTTNTSGNVRGDYGTDVRVMRNRGFLANFAGGDMAVTAQTQINSAQGTIQTVGSNLTVTYVGRDA